MISQTAEFALRAIVTIAQHGGEPCTALEIAASIDVYTNTNIVVEELACET